VVSIESVEGKVLSLDANGSVIVAAIPSASDPSDPDDDLPNAASVTLKFQKGDTIVSLDVLCSIVKKGEEGDRAAAPLQQGDTVLYFGIDVIKSGYVGPNTVKRGADILDFEKVRDQEFVQTTNTSQSGFETASGSSVVEMFNELNAKASVSYKGVLFTGDVAVDYAASSNNKKTSNYAKGKGLYVVKQEFLKRSTTRALKSLLDQYFIDDINDKNVSAATILDTYGTHLIASAYWGGAGDFNYSYTGTALTSNDKVKAALNFAIGKKFDAKASVGSAADAKELNDFSVFTLAIRGGNSVSWKTPEQVDAGYDAWVQSIKANPNVCGVPNYDTTTLVPIWELAKTVNAARGAEIEKEFEARVKTQGAALAGFSANATGFITDINVYENRRNATLPTGYTHWVGNDMYESKGQLDLWWHHVSEITMAYKIGSTADNHNAIADIMVYGRGDTLPNGWNYIRDPYISMVQYNSNGKVHCLAYRKVNSSDTSAIDFIGAVTTTQGSNLSEQILSGYTWVTGAPNGAGGRFNLLWLNNDKTYLTVHKSPFKW
jgi:hypothetical protein